MGYTTSTVHGIEVPDSAEANNVPEDIGKVVTALEAGSLVKRLTGAQISALTSPQKPAGLLVYNTTTSKLQVSNGTSFADIDAAAIAAQSTANAALPKSGGTMSGPIAMGGNKVTGLAAGSAAGDAVRYEQLTALGAYSAWTPTLTASGSNPTASATSGENRYTQIGQHVSGVGYVNVTAAGGGTYQIPLPVTPKSSTAPHKQIGWATLIVDDGSAYARTYRLVQTPSQSYCHAVDFDSVLVPAINLMSNIDVSDIDGRGGSVYLAWQFTYEAA